jgi:hypothetical protein
MERMNNRRLAVVMAALTGLMGAGCGSGDPSNGPTTAVQRPASTGMIEILEPTPGAVVQGTEVPVRIELTGATLAEQVTTDIKPDEGHIHLKVDGRTVTILGTLEERLTGLSAGSHVLEVEFVAADHGPFNPRVIQVVTFTVE